MPYTDKTSVLAQVILNKITTNLVALGLDGAYYGDQNNIPVAKAAVVMPGIKRRILDGVGGPGGRSRNYMEVFIFIYNSTVGDEGTQRLVTDQLAEAVETLLHSEVTFGGTITQGFVENMDPGITFINGSQFRTVQMTFTGLTKTQITA